MLREKMLMADRIHLQKVQDRYDNLKETKLTKHSEYAKTIFTN